MINIFLSRNESPFSIDGSSAEQDVSANKNALSIKQYVIKLFIRISYISFYTNFLIPFRLFGIQITEIATNITDCGPAEIEIMPAMKIRGRIAA
ncbi:hypothetical protein GCM10027516_08730 [Niabella aquatica]